ncbi:MAG: DUF3987 domain-containing protein [Flavobacteriales bacterium]|nr:DUF3987 domain-containing protein [Flavobacteriales bacterium]
MKRFLPPFVLSICMIVIHASCNEASNSEEKWRSELEEVKTELESLKAELQQAKDTSDKEAIMTSLEEKTPVEPKMPAETEREKVVTPPSKPDPIPVKKEEISVVKKDSGEIYYFKNSEKPSLRISPWKEGKRELTFYNKSGEVTYVQDDVNIIYHEISEVKGIHENGAISQILIHQNPGASRNWSEALITFSEDNEPELKTITIYPVETITQYANNTYRYDRIGKKWVSDDMKQRE